MLFFKKKTQRWFDKGAVQTDMHSHLIPGIDDGSPDLETSVALVKGLSELGYKKIITTPHVLNEVYPNTSETILSGLATLREELNRQKIEVEVNAAAEYFMDEYFSDLLRKKQPLLTISKNLVLVEFSMMTAPLDLQSLIFEMQMQNYQPVIAHPERYIYLIRNKNYFQTLKDAGCYLQLNLLSLSGHYGKTVQELANYLAEGEHYDLVGTDMHNIRHLEALQQMGSSKLLDRVVEGENFKNNLL